jgi:DNA primase
MNHAHPTRGNTRKPFGFKRNLIPNPVEYFHEQGMKLFGGGEWKSAICPFHNDTKPSLRVRLDTGGYRCMVCGAKGGDILAFHMQRHGLRFIEAAKALGAWEVEI